MSQHSYLPHRFLGLVCRKWVGPIVAKLAEGPIRFGTLARAYPGLSKRVLAAQLRRLRDTRIVQREEVPGRQVTIHYSLTRKGEAFYGVLQDLRRWEKRYLGNAGDHA
jgi:DNA-binding HxlR family transcriptional regulator